MHSKDLQLEFTRYLRDPSGPPPLGLDARPIGIYADLVYNNFDGFLAGFFPVLRSLLADDRWNSLVRAFVREHHCQTPYFLEIGQEFLQFLMQSPTQLADYPSFTLVLAHYEWVELALDISSIQLPPRQQVADVLDGYPQLSPLAWPLSYPYAVHRIGPDNPAPEPEPTHLLVYRNRADEVKFLATNDWSQRLLQLLSGQLSGRQACATLALELQHSAPAQLALEAQDLLLEMVEMDIVVAVTETPED